jgi:glycosyltransferase involved in cell wall biosynthesis
MATVVKKKLRVLYLQPGTTIFAGVERVVDTICTELSINHGDEFAVDVLRVSQHRCYPPEPRRYTSLMRPVTSRLGLMWTFRQVVQEKSYDLVVVPQIDPTVIFWFSRLGIRQRIAMHLHGNPRREVGHLKAKILFFLLRHLVLRRITAVFGTSPQQLKSFRQDFNCDRPMFWVPNPVRDFEVPSGFDKPESATINFVNVGRYDFQKGQDILIDAFAELYARRKDVRLSLVGHGADEDALSGQIRRLGLSEVIKLEHHPDNPQQVLFASDVFVATSRWEGWSLVICEALRCGLPVVSTDCEFGPSDILVDPRLGRLVPPDDVEALVEAMEYYCDHLAHERQFAAFRREHIDQYSVEKTAKVHADAIRKSVAMS